MRFSRMLVPFAALFCLLSSPLLADSSSTTTSSTSTTTYDDIRFPQWSKDLRRTEIITFGSLPFVTIWVTVAYSAVEYGEFRNPLNKSSDGYTAGDQKRIMQAAALSCIGLGLTDLAITLIRRKNARHRSLRNRRPDAITIQELSRKQDGDGPPERGHEQEYLQGGIESALF